MKFDNIKKEFKFRINPKLECFLKEEKAYEAFVENLNRAYLIKKQLENVLGTYPFWDYEFYKIDNLELNDINGAFHWRPTKQGHCYWADLSYKYNKLLNKNEI